MGNKMSKKYNINKEIIEDNKHNNKGNFKENIIIGKVKVRKKNLKQKIINSYENVKREDPEKWNKMKVFNENEKEIKNCEIFINKKKIQFNIIIFLKKVFI